MISDPTVALRKELTDALDLLEPQIRGIANWLLLPVSTELRQELIKDGEDLGRRKLFLTEARDACDALVEKCKTLDGDNYPLLPVREVPANLEAELQADNKDIDMAVARFKPATLKP